MSQWLQGKVIEHRAWTDTLFSLKVEAPKLSFEAGQFVRLALDVNGERIARPFSFVNPPQDPVLEFYGVIVPEGPLSPPLARLRAGDALYLADNPSGFLVLSEVPPAEDLWLVATGTGIAPYLSILRTDATWQRYQRASPGRASPTGGIASVSRIPGAMELWYCGAAGSIEDSFWYA